MEALKLLEDAIKEGLISEYFINHSAVREVKGIEIRLKAQYGDTQYGRQYLILVHDLDNARFDIVAYRIKKLLAEFRLAKEAAGA